MAVWEPTSIGTLLQQFRRAAGLTQEELAERAGVSTHTISDLERGVRRTPYPHTLRRLVDVLGLSSRDRDAVQRAVHGGRREMAPGAVDPELRLLAFPLVGRERELAALESHLASPDPPLLVLAGEPGIGKSRLLQEAIRQADTGEFTVLYAGCQRPTGQAPYTPLVNALSRYLDAQPAARLRAVLRGCGWLVSLLPELLEIIRAPLPLSSLPSGQERRLMASAVRCFLANVAGPSGTLLVLDDLQWAGSDALDLLASLVRFADTRLRLIAAYRSGEVGPTDPLGVFLADLAHARLARQITLRPLEHENAAQLLDALLEGTSSASDEVRQQIVQRTGGVPFFLISCADAWNAGVLNSERMDEVPWDVAQSIRQRLAALDTTAQEVLETAALIGRSIPRTLLLAVSRKTEDDVYRALETANRTMLLLEDGKAHYHFAHDVIREVIEQGVGIARRVAIHRRIAEVLEQSMAAEGAAARVAWHFLQGQEPGRALPFALLAGEQAEAAYAHAEAEQQYRIALKLTRAGGSARGESVLLQKLATVLENTAKYDEALELLEQAAQLSRKANDTDGEARVVALLGEVHGLRGTTYQGIERLDCLLASLDRTASSSAVAVAHLTRANLLFVTGQYRHSLEAAEHAHAMARAIGDEQILLDAEFRLGTARGDAGDTDEALVALEAVAGRAEALGSRRTLMAALNNMACIYERQGAFTQCEVCWTRYLQLAEQMELPDKVAWALSQLAWVCFWQGDWQRAGTCLDRSQGMLHSLGPCRARLAYLNMRGELCLVEGRWEIAVAHLEEAALLADQSGGLQSALGILNLLAEFDLLQGRPRAAVARLRPIVKRAHAEGRQPDCWSPILATAYLEIGHHGRASEILAKGIATARERNHRQYLVHALCASARVAGCQQHWDQAEHALNELLSLARELSFPFAEARGLYEYGVLHLEKNEPQLARGKLEAGLAIFRRLGARPSIERTEQVLGQLT